MSRDAAQQIAILLIIIVTFAHVAYQLRRNQDLEIARSTSAEDAEAELAAVRADCDSCEGPCDYR